MRRAPRRCHRGVGAAERERLGQADPYLAEIEVGGLADQGGAVGGAPQADLEVIVGLRRVDEQIRLVLFRGLRCVDDGERQGLVRVQGDGVGELGRGEGEVAGNRDGQRVQLHRGRADVLEDEALLGGAADGGKGELEAADEGDQSAAPVLHEDLQITPAGRCLTHQAELEDFLALVDA